MMKTYKISYSGNATRFKGIAETVEASSPRDAVEKFYSNRLDRDYFPECSGIIRDCDGNIIAIGGDDSIEYDGGFFFAVECKRGSFEVCCRENGDVIEDGLNKDEANELIERYEAMDRREGSYSPDFYEARRSR